MSRFRRLLPACALLLAILLAACSGGTSLVQNEGGQSSATATAAGRRAPQGDSGAFKVNDKIKIGEDQYITVQKVKLWNGNGFIKADPGNKIVAVKVQIEGISKDGASYNPFFFTVKDPKGFEYNFSAFGEEPQLQSGNNLDPGDKVTGWVNFEVPKKTKKLTLEYQPDFFDIGHPARVKIAVP